MNDFQKAHYTQCKADLLRYMGYVEQLKTGELRVTARIAGGSFPDTSEEDIKDCERIIASLEAIIGRYEAKMAQEKDKSNL